MNEPAIDREINETFFQTPKKKICHRASFSTPSCLTLQNLSEMDCTTTKKNLFSFLENKVSPEESLQIAAHLKDCKHCNGQYLQLKQVLAQLPNLKQENPNPFLFTRIEQQISQEQEQTQDLPRFARIFNPVLVSVLLVATVVIGISMFSQNNATSTTPGENQTSMIASQYHMNASDQDVIETYYLTEE